MTCSKCGVVTHQFWRNARPQLVAIGGAPSRFRCHASKISMWLSDGTYEMICELYLLTTTSTNTTKQTHGYTWAFPSKWIAKIQNSDILWFHSFCSHRIGYSIRNNPVVRQDTSASVAGFPRPRANWHCAPCCQCSYLVCSREKQNSLHWNDLRSYIWNKNMSISKYIYIYISI